MLVLAGLRAGWTQEVTTKAPPVAQAAPLNRLPTESAALPDAPGEIVYPDAVPVRPDDPGETVTLDSATQTEQDGVFTLEGAAVVTARDRRVEADRIVYDKSTGDLELSGHVRLTGGANHERLSASHGEFNLHTQTGRLYDVAGSAGLSRSASPTARARPSAANAFLFSGRLVVKTGPSAYDIFDGTVTSCQLPHPDWELGSAHFSVEGEQARAHNSTFRLLNVPVLFLPYVTHSLDAEDRQSGFLIPTSGNSSARGFSVGEQIFFVLNRSADLTVGAEYFSKRGFAQSAAFRYRGQGLDFVTARYAGLLDRRSGEASSGGSAVTPTTGATTGNQGGEDLLLAGRRDFSPGTRVAANVEYLSSYIYREAFSDNFNQAINSDIVSVAYGTRQRDGLEASVRGDRYQGLKFISTASGQQQIRILHVPSLSFSTTDHHLGSTGLEWTFDAEAAGLKRSQPNFVTGGVVERLDLHPEVAYPFSLGAWRVRPAVAARETLYTRTRVASTGTTPIAERNAGLARSDFELSVGLLAPVLARTFTPSRWTGLLGKELRHTIAPEFTYRLVSGISNFGEVLRFDATDVQSNTHEAEFGVTQRLFRRGASAGGSCSSVEGGLDPEPTDARAGDPLGAAETAATGPVLANSCTGEELLSWRLTQKYFFDPRFGGAVLLGRRNIFASTLDLSGVAFLTEPRELSPLISRLRVRSSAHTDLEWDFDLDEGAKRFTSSNVFVDAHAGPAFAALSYARLDAPGRSYTQVILSPTNTAGGTSSVSDFNQLRVLLGYGGPAKPGLSLAVNLGLDLKNLTGTTSTISSAGSQPVAHLVYPALVQYTAVQSAYNWNCCGVAFEYRKFEIGAVQNVPGYKFSFSLANVGTAGNLRRAQRLF